MSESPLEEVLRRARACTLCASDLPLGPRPIVSASTSARLVIVGQAPGTKVHASGIPWDDPSGDHLRLWLNVTKEEFYDPTLISIMPMGFCYPGRKGQGDAPPRRECAPAWHGEIAAHLHSEAVFVLAGQYAVNYYLNPRTNPSIGKEHTKEKTLTQTVRKFATYLPRYFPLPHPSWRSKVWMKKNPWFEEEVIPTLRTTVVEALAASVASARGA